MPFFNFIVLNINFVVLETPYCIVYEKTYRVFVKKLYRERANLESLLDSIFTCLLNDIISVLVVHWTG